MKLMGDNKVVAGYHAGVLAVKDPKSIRAALEAVIKLYDEGKVKPEVHEVFSLEEVKRLNMSFKMNVWVNECVFFTDQRGNAVHARP